MVRIGIMLTSSFSECQKNELFRYKKSKPNEWPWNKHVPKEEILKQGSGYGVATDLAVGCFIQHAYGKQGVEVDFIGWEDLSAARLAANDLNFLLIFDLLESFHILANDRKRWYEIRDCLRKAKNVFPPWHYQEFCCSKIAYYRHLREHNVDILPTLTMTAAEYKTLGHERAVQKVLGHAQAKGWQKLIAKPEWGQESRDAKFFKPSQGSAFGRHVKRCMKKYPGIIFQKAIDGFGSTKENGELRMMYVGERYHYSILETHKGMYTYSPEEKRDKGELDMVPVKLLKRRSREVLKKLPPLVMPNGARLPRFIDRVDMGFNDDGKLRPFVNEIEYCPSYFIATVSDERGAKLIKSIGHQIVKTTTLYLKQSVSQHTGSPGAYEARKRKRADGPSVTKKRKRSE